MDILLKLNILKGHWKRLGWGPLETELALSEGKLHIKSSKIQVDHGVIDVKGLLSPGEEPHFYSSGIFAKNSLRAGLMKIWLRSKRFNALARV